MAHGFGFLCINDQPTQRSRWLNNDRWREWPKNHKPGKNDRAGQLITFEGDTSMLKHPPSNSNTEMVCILAQYGVMGNGVVKDVNPVAGTLRWHSKQLNVAIPRHLNEVGYNFENAVSLIDEPGEWAVDTCGPPCGARPSTRTTRKTRASQINTALSWARPTTNR